MILSKQSLAERSLNNSICSEQFEWWKQKDAKFYWTQNQLGPFHTSPQIEDSIYKLFRNIKDYTS